MSTDTKPGFTDRQAKAWPEALADAHQHVGETIPADLCYWTVQWGEESRPGRGQAFKGTWVGGDYFVGIYMDVYGYPSVSVAILDWIHVGSNEDCDCDVCVREKAA